MSNIKKTEERIYEAVKQGAMVIDSQGRIWRIRKRAWNRWKQCVRMDKCRRVRAEHHLPSGYLQVRAMFNKTRHNGAAHRLVWLHFNGPIPDGLVINHKNGIKSDNRPSNLEVVTPSENVKHAYKIGLKDEHGEKNPNHKLTNGQVEAIRTVYAAGQKTQNALARMHGVTFQTISRIVRGDSRKKERGQCKDYTHRRQRKVMRHNASGQFRSA